MSVYDKVLRTMSYPLRAQRESPLETPPAPAGGFAPEPHLLASGQVAPALQAAVRLIPNHAGGSGRCSEDAMLLALARGIGVVKRHSRVTTPAPKVLGCG